MVHESGMKSRVAVVIIVFYMFHDFSKFLFLVLFIQQL